jgi:hypothetical protein
MRCSRRHTPVTGMTTSASDTRDQVPASRRWRRRGCTALASGRVAVVTRRKAGDVWNFAEDGQQCFDPRSCRSGRHVLAPRMRVCSRHSRPRTSGRAVLVG